MPEFALAGESVLPMPRVLILDAGGNVANVSEEVGVRVLDGGEVQASAVTSVEGVAVFTDMKLSPMGPQTVEFFFGDVTVARRVVVLQSRPALLSNPLGLPVNVQRSMSPIRYHARPFEPSIKSHF